MTGRKKPVFGMISLALMVSLILLGVLVTVYGPSAPAIGNDDSLAVVIESAANIIATLLVITVVSLSAIILTGVSLLRKETVWPAAVSFCLSLSALIVVALAVTKL